MRTLCSLVERKLEGLVLSGKEVAWDPVHTWHRRHCEALCSQVERQQGFCSVLAESNTRSSTGGKKAEQRLVLASPKGCLGPVLARQKVSVRVLCSQVQRQQELVYQIQIEYKFPPP